MGSENWRFGVKMYQNSRLNHMGCPVCIYLDISSDMPYDLIYHFGFLLSVPLLFFVDCLYTLIIIQMLFNVNSGQCQSMCISHCVFFSFSFLLFKANIALNLLRNGVISTNYLSWKILWFGTIVRNESKSWFFSSPFSRCESSFKRKKLNKKTTEETSKQKPRRIDSHYILYSYIDEVDRYAIVIKIKH